MSLCFEEKASFNSWLSCLRLAKFGNQLRDAYIAKDTASCHDASSPAARTTQGCAAAAVAGVTVPSSDNFRLFSKFGKLRLLSGGSKKADANSTNTKALPIGVPQKLTGDLQVSRFNLYSTFYRNGV